MIFKSLKIKTLAFLSSLFVFAFLAGVVLAQESPEDIAARYGVTFPIAELGGCDSYSACQAYCEDPVNYTACIDFAKDKGFYDEEVAEEKEDFLKRARVELGCDSYQSCQSFCEQPTNYEKCSEFAKRHDFSGGYEDDPAKGDILAKAKDILGCDSHDSCKAYCENPANQERCSEFARQVGLRGGEYEAGPGGCTTEATCREFCSDPNNFDLCSRYASSTGDSFVGPGDCNSEESCRTYCETNSDECRYFGSEAIDPEQYCRQFPEKCAGIEEEVSPEEFEQYCLKYPGECSGSTVGYDPKVECSKTPDCSWVNNTCQCFSSGYEGSLDPAAECSNYGCSWTGTSCQCSESEGTYSPPAEEEYDPATECAKVSGCSWTGTTCQCEPPSEEPTSGSTDAATACAQGGCNWTGSTCECPSETPSSEVYGVTAGGLLQRILQLLFGR